MSKRTVNGDVRSKPKKKKQRVEYDIREENSDDDSFDEEVEGGEMDETEVMDATSSVIEESRLIIPRKSSHVKVFNGMNALPGIILRVSMNNFMCHNHLEVQLGKHVNFIVGSNGSGKSAVITALVVGLGGKASVTNRGSSIKNFVKQGKKSAWVEVCLNNKGKDSYKPGEYGDLIVVRRKFNTDGASSYSISNATGQLVTDKKDELLRITDHMNIQVDNPVSILNQDTSRNFLNGKTSADKFKFFMKATQLEQMNTEYDHVKKIKEQIRQIISSKDQTIPKMKSEVKVWENKFKNMTAISDLKEKVKKMKHEMAWALVGEKENGLKPLQKALQTERTALPKYVGKVDEAKVFQENCVKKHKEVEEKLIHCGREVGEMQPKLEERRKSLISAKEVLSCLLNQLRAIDRELRTAKQECQQCQVRIEELKTLASHDFEAERREREAKIEELEGKIAELENKRRVTEHEVEQYRSAVAKYKSDVGGLESQIRSKQIKVRETRNALETLKYAQNDRLQRFGQWVPAILQKIKDNKSRFHKPPRGPLGAHFTLSDQKWALAVECCLKGLISAFVVHDVHDEKLLEEMFHSSNCPKYKRPTIIRSAFSERVHDVSRNRVKHNNYPCVLDVIQCKDPVIINTLIDQRGIETVLLIEKSEEARNVMMRNPPKNSRECFTVDGDQAFCSPTFRYYTEDRNTARFLMANVKDQIVALGAEMNTLEKAVTDLMQKKDELNVEILQNQREEKKCQMTLNKIGDSRNRMKFDIQELQTAEDPDPVDVTTLEGEVSTYQQKMQELEAKKVEVNEKKKDADAVLDNKKEEYTKLEAEIAERSDSELPLRDELIQSENAMVKAKNDLKHYIGKMKKQENRIDDLSKEVECYKKAVECEREKALQISEPIVTKRTANDIENEIEQSLKRIGEEEDQHGNEEEVTNTYAQKKAGLQRVIREVAKLKSFVEKLHEVMARRQVAYQRMRERIADRTKFHFLMQMHHRSFTGKMDFNFKDGTLEIQVTTSKGQGGGRETKDLKSLSGGERSFSTVCFILSLWEAMESPFRCLDEFDVFMDMVSRRISMDMMMETADMHKNLQFVFLTPQDMSSIRKIDNVEIFRMPDPERSDSQSTLHFSQLSQH